MDYNATLQANNTALQAILETINALPEAGEPLPESAWDEPTTLEQIACLARVKQMRDITYTPVAALPWGGVGAATTKPAGTPITGIPYSSVRLTDNFIGFNRSIYSWLTAIKNPKADIYTKKSTETIAETWWGVNCSVFVSYVYGWPYHNATAIFPDTPGIVEIDVEDMQLCDAACYQNEASSTGGGHVIIITGIERDSTGAIINVEISEAAADRVRAMTYTLSSFESLLAANGYKMYRNTKLHEVLYQFNEYNDEPLDDIEQVGGDLSSTMGDKFTIKTTDTVTLNPLVTSGYTGIELYRNGLKVDTYAVGDVELSNLAAGKYKATLVPENDHSSIRFIVAEVTATYAGNRYSFAGVEAEPIRVVFKSSLGYTQDACDLTVDDVALGYKDIALTADRVVVPFRNEYGFVTQEAVYQEPDVDIPAEYKRLSYIATDGNQHIDTGINASNYSDGIQYVFKGRVSGYKVSNNNNYFFGCLGSGVRSGNFSYDARSTEVPAVLYIGANSNQIKQSTFVPVGTDFTIQVKASSATTNEDSIVATINGSAMIRSDAAFASGAMPNANIYLFTANGVSASNGKFWGECDSFTMAAVDGTAIRNFVPVRRIADSVVGMYDTVSGAFFTNSGTGSFTAGPEV